MDSSLYKSPIYINIKCNHENITLWLRLSSLIIGYYNHSNMQCSDVLRKILFPLLINILLALIIRANDANKSKECN